MNIKVVVGFNLNAQAWADEYGVDLKDVRQDVIAHVGGLMREHLRSMGMLEEG